MRDREKYDEALRKQKLKRIGTYTKSKIIYVRPCYQCGKLNEEFYQCYLRVGSISRPFHCETIMAYLCYPCLEDLGFIYR